MMVEKKKLNLIGSFRTPTHFLQFFPVLELDFLAIIYLIAIDLEISGQVTGEII